MTRINTNVLSLNSLHNLQRSHASMRTSLERLSSGLRINRAADDPAGLIASEFLRAEIGSLQQAIDNSERAVNVVATAEGALNEISALLTDIRSLVIEAANRGGIVDEEIEANQLQIDSAIETINRIANTTQFAGIKLLDGSRGFVTSGLATSQITDLTIYAAQFGQMSTIPVDVTVVTNAELAQLTFANSLITSSVVLEVAGKEGTEVFHFVSGTAASAILAAVNHMADATGISASYINDGAPASGIHFNSRDYGSSAFVSVRALSGTFSLQGGVSRDTGEDAVVTVNGQVARADGLTVSFNTDSLDLKLAISADVADGTDLDRFTITGGGALFQLGADVTLAQQVNLGIQSVASHNLGGVSGRLSDLATGGTYSLTGSSLTISQRIIDEAIDDISTLRGRLGAFQRNTLETNINSLQVALENLTAAENLIRDADFATETAALTRAQILVQAGASVLSMANASPQSVLNLLG